jgi:hypothetical protein
MVGIGGFGETALPWRKLLIGYFSAPPGGGAAQNWESEKNRLLPLTTRIPVFRKSKKV